MFYMFVSFIHSLAELEFAVNDALMRYFDKCERFVKEVESNKSALEEVKHFNEGPEMKRVMEKMADRLEVPYASITDGQWWYNTIMTLLHKHKPQMLKLSSVQNVTAQFRSVIVFLIYVCLVFIERVVVSWPISEYMLQVQFSLNVMLLQPQPQDFAHRYIITHSSFSISRQTEMQKKHLDENLKTNKIWQSLFVF